MPESKLKRASDILDRLMEPVQRGRYAEKTWRDDYNDGLDALFDALEEAGLFDD